MRPWNWLVSLGRVGWLVPLGLLGWLVALVVFAWFRLGFSLFCCGFSRLIPLGFRVGSVTSIIYLGASVGVIREASGDLRIRF